MKIVRDFLLSGLGALGLVLTGSAGTLYVDINNPAPAVPYTNWAMAATNIQDAVDAAVAGDEILVTNGVYSTGSRAVYGRLPNRVAINRAVVVRSVTGPNLTWIVGRGAGGTGTSFGEGAVRCVYVGTNAVLSGFTLTNGYTQLSESTGGGAWCEPSGVVTNCALTGNSAYDGGGGAYGGTLNNCTLIGNFAISYGGGVFNSTLNKCTLISNSAFYGGGANGGTLNDCTLIGNSASDYNGGAKGGGAYGGTLNNCTLSGNSAFWDGGGASFSVLNNCTLSGNSARFGGGTLGGTLNNCILIGNSAGREGGGAYFGTTLNNCTLTGNSAEDSGGAVSYGTLSNCTLTGNSARGYGGGASHDTLNNCIVYCNTAPFGANYDDSSIFAYSCTTPLPAGPGNIANLPLFMDTNGWSNLRLQNNSPCINAGNNAFAPGTTDLDGNLRIRGGLVDIGAYEFLSPASVLPYWWLQTYGLTADGSADYSDSDGDGLNNWQEWRCQTDPTNSQSALRLRQPARQMDNVLVTWESVAGVAYVVEYSTNLSFSPMFQALTPTIYGAANITSIADTNAALLPPRFYRVRVLDP